MLDFDQKGWLAAMLPSYRKLFGFSVLLGILLLGGVAAQQVTITPRPKPAVKEEVLPKADIRVNTTLVLIPVTVTDPLNRFVTGLEKENFKLAEDKVDQSIISFSSEDAPISVGVIFDCSGSMSNKMEKSRQAVAQFFKTANPEDEFFLVQFNNNAQLIQPFTHNLEEIQNKLTLPRPRGRRRCLMPFIWACMK
jgi:Ca-activated chloride channel family protein